MLAASYGAVESRELCISASQLPNCRLLARYSSNTSLLLRQYLEPMAGIAPNRSDFRDIITEFIELLKRTLSLLLPTLLLPFISHFVSHLW